MPLTTMRVLRVDSVTRSGKHGLFEAYLVTGSEGPEDLGAFQVHTTSFWQAAVAKCAMDKQIDLKVLWRDGRHGKHMVSAELVQPNGDAA